MNNYSYIRTYMIVDNFYVYFMREKKMVKNQYYNFLVCKFSQMLRIFSVKWGFFLTITFLLSIINLFYLLKKNTVIWNLKKSLLNHKSQNCLAFLKEWNLSINDKKKV